MTKLNNKLNEEKLTGYHWAVIIIASLGWLFDCMDQRLFILARQSAVTDLLGVGVDSDLIKKYGGYATTSMILGWATGGIIFGIFSDRFGRVKSMMITLLCYSVFTGLSGFSRNIEEFIIYRFIVGLGVGGMFGSATTLIAESVPGKHRVVALGALQTLAALGNIIGSLITVVVPPGAEVGLFGYSGWRSLFFFGIIPALLIVPMMCFLKEPKVWLDLKKEREEGDPATAKKSGSPIEMFKHPRWRKNALVGLCLGVSGMVGLWGVGFFAPELISEALEGESQAEVDKVRGYSMALMDVGAFFGMAAFTFVAAKVSRRMAFFLSLMLCFCATVYVFNNLNSAMDAYWMLPILGFALLSIFAGYSIYFPELFPTRLRGTGVVFCYNTVRYLAAPAPILIGYLSTLMPFRTAATVMACIYIVGMIALIWAPETKDQPLPVEV